MAAVGEAKPGGQVLHNWNHCIASQPAVVVRAKSAEDVCAAVRDAARFPSPVLAVGSAHSVTGVLRNEGGTVIEMGALDEILGLDTVGGQEVVRVQGGVKLAALHKWLDARGKEMSFSPVIGDATVGSIVGSTSKDSSVDGPGCISSLVAAVAFVDETGTLKRASLDGDAASQKTLARVTCAYGLMGIVVEACLLVRKHTLVRTFMTMQPMARSAPGARVAALLSKARSECDNLFVIMHPMHDQVYVEQRWLVKGTSRVPFPITPIAMAVLRPFRFASFKRGQPLPALISPFVSANRFLRLNLRHRRSGFTTTYAPVTKREDRLDFTYFEFDVSRFDEVVAGCWELAAEHARRTGFCPKCFAMYFVQRPGGKLAGSYTGEAGTSFMLDPIHSDPEDPRWRAFNDAYALWAVALGGNVSLSQTKGLPASHELGGALPASLARDRFVTPFFRSYIVGDGEYGAVASYARPAGDDHPRRAALMAEYRRLLLDAAAAAAAAPEAAAAARPSSSTPPPSPQPPKTYVGRLMYSLGLSSAAAAPSSGDSDTTADSMAAPSPSPAPSTSPTPET